MSLDSVYRGVLMEHYRQPRNQGDLAGWEHVARASNPLCGDEIEVGTRLADGRLAEIRFRARARSVCIASASLMTEAAGGRSPEEARLVVTGLRRWFRGGGERPEAVPEALAPLDAVRSLPARERCVTLPWEGLLAAAGGAG